MTAIAAIDVEAVRADTPGCARGAHFNAAGSALMPRPVIKAIGSHLELEAAVDGYRAADQAHDAIEDAYRAYAELLGTQPANIAICENATDAFSRALSAIELKPGDLILTSENDYVSNQITYLSLVKRLGVRLERLPEDPRGGFDAEAADRIIRQRAPRVVALSHVPTNSGLVQPVAAVADACAETGAYYLLDACQSIGQLELDVVALGCDFLSASARKFLRGPRGSGVLYVSDRVLAEGLEPLYLDMRGARWEAADRYVPESSARRFETWENPYALIIGAGVAVRYALDLGIAAIGRHLAAEAAALRAKLAEVPGIRVLDRGEHRCAIVTFAHERISAGAVNAHLDRHGITASVSQRDYAVIDFARKGAEAAVRVAPHCYTSHEDIDRLLGALADS